MSKVDFSIILGGMGVYIGNPPLAKAFSCWTPPGDKPIKEKALGTVSVILAEFILVRELQKGNINFVRALETFPIPGIAEPIIKKYFVEGGIEPGTPYAKVETFSLYPTKELVRLTTCAVYALVWLAKEGHDNPISMNTMQKVQLQTLPALLGGMLAGVDFVTVGAGIPGQFSGILDGIANGENPALKVYGEGLESGHVITLNVKDVFGLKLPKMKRPGFIPIVSSHVIASSLLKNSPNGIQAFTFENAEKAGGHSAAPRGQLLLNEHGEPVYGPKDQFNYQEINNLLGPRGIPWYYGGGMDTPEKLKWALSLGASGIQIGTSAALADISGMDPSLKRTILDLWSKGELVVLNNPSISPSDLPFRVAEIMGTASDENLRKNRKLICDIGAMQRPILTRDGKLKYHCPVMSKGSEYYCLCNGLLATAGLGSPNELQMATLGNSFEFLTYLISKVDPRTGFYTVDTLLKYLFGYSY